MHLLICRYLLKLCILLYKFGKTLSLWRLRLYSSAFTFRDKWVAVNTAWRFLSLSMKERPPLWRAAANILNKQSRTADKGWYTSFGVVRGANNSSP